MDEVNEAAKKQELLGKAGRVRTFSGAYATDSLSGTVGTTTARERGQTVPELRSTPAGGAATPWQRSVTEATSGEPVRQRVDSALLSHAQSKWPPETRFMNDVLHRSIDLASIDVVQLANRTTQPSSDLLDDVTKADTSRRGFLNTKLIRLHEDSAYLEIGARAGANPYDVKTDLREAIKISPRTEASFEDEAGATSKLESRQNILVSGESPHAQNKLQASKIRVDVKHRATQKRSNGRQAESGQLAPLSAKTKWKNVPNMHMESADGPIRQQLLLDLSSHDSSRCQYHTISCDPSGRRTRNVVKSPDIATATPGALIGHVSPVVAGHLRAQTQLQAAVLPPFRPNALRRPKPLRPFPAKSGERKAPPQTGLATKLPGSLQGKSILRSGGSSLEDNGTP